MQKILLTCLFAITAIITQAKGPIAGTANVSVSQNSAPLAFMENKGQVTDQNRNARTDIQFSLKAAPGLNIFIGTGAIHYQFSKANVTKSFSTPATHKAAPNLKGLSHDSLTFTMYRMDVELIGANQNSEVVTEEKQDYYENYFTDWSGEKGVTVRSYTRITYKDIYPYIDWVLYIKNGQLEHEFVIHEGGKASDIQLKYGGATNLKINDADGSLTAATPQGTITEQAPKSFQPVGNPVKTGFILHSNVLTYETNNYKGALVIDPTLQWATYYGGGSLDEGLAVATDSGGNVYITGYTTSSSDIATVGAYQTTFGNLNGGGTAFVAKFNATGTSPLWGTYYGGAAYAYGVGIALDAGANVYITGYTTDTTGIATPGAYQTAYGGTWYTSAAFVAKFNATGTSLLWGTYYGGMEENNSGPGETSGQSITLDASDNVYITGGTSSTTGIATPGAYQTTYSGTGSDAFVAKFNATGTSLLWGTYYGGTSEDAGFGIALDTNDNVYITGVATSSTGIATTGAYQTTFGGGTSDAFVAKFDPTGNSLLWGTYYGGTEADYGYGIALDAIGNVYITGSTESATGIATPGAYQTTFGSDFNDAFVAKFSTTGTLLLWSTYYGGHQGGNLGTSGQSIALDASGNVYITGSTSDSAGIATPGAYQTTFGNLNGGSNAFLAQFNANGASLLWGSYYGGAGAYYDNGDQGNGIAIDRNGNLYITGNTYSTTGIATPGAYQTTLVGTEDAFVAKFGFCTSPMVATITGPTSVCSFSTITLANTTTGGIWGSNNTGIATVNTVGVVTGAGAGIDTIIYSVTNTCGTSSAIFSIEVKSLPTATIIPTGATTFCPGDSVILTASAGASYLWNNNATTQSIDVKAPDTYSVIVTDNNGCKATSNQINVTTYPVVAVSITASGDTLTSYGAGAYQWYLNNQLIPGDTGSVFIATQPGDYTVETTDSNSCHYTSSIVQITTAVNNVNQVYVVKIYPNPAKSSFVIETTITGEQLLTVYDMTGKLLVVQNIKNSITTINTTGLAVGIYTVNLKSADGMVTKKLVVEK